MKRFWKIPVVILVGTITNVAIAWSCAQLVPLHKLNHWEPGEAIPDRLVPPIPNEWLVPMHDPAGQISISYTEFARFGARAMLAEVWELAPDQKYYPNHSYSRWQVGWPMKSLACIAIRGPSGTPEFQGAISLPGREGPADGEGRPARRRSLPARILPLGFALDTLLYSATAFLLLYIPTALRWYGRGWNDEQSWRRTAFRLAPCGVAGAIASVLVAWSCFLWMPIATTVTSRRYRIENETEHWRINNQRLATAPRGQWTDGMLDTDPSRGHPWNGTPVVSSELMASRFRHLEQLNDTTFPHYANRADVCALQEWLGVQAGWGVRIDYLSLDTYSERGLGGPSFKEQRAGWPLHCVRAYDDGGVSGTIGLIEPPRWLHAREYSPGTRCLLSVPVWTGLIGDTLFYGCMGWCALFGPGVLRRAHRAAREQCTWCAYDRRGIDEEVACPECGKRP